MSELSKVYEGFIFGLKDKYVLIKFRDGFVQTFSEEDTYFVDFYVNRKPFMLHHRMVELITQKIDEHFLFPKHLDEKLPPKIDVKYNVEEYAFQLNGQHFPWINGNLNMVQKRAVVQVLRNELPKSPYVIYGPPGKYSSEKTEKKKQN